MSSRTLSAESSSYDGVTRAEIARVTGCENVHLFHAIGSTMDVAHDLASLGAPGGALIIAESQTMGRGREGRAWKSGSEGVWLTLLSRNPDPGAAQVLALRIGLALRAALQPHSDGLLTIKWPNDILLDAGKVAGILVETRWREALPLWTSIGVGINVREPEGLERAAGLRAGTSKLAVLESVVPELLDAAARTGSLTAAELSEYLEVDFLRGKRITAPSKGVVIGISREGELVLSVGNVIETVRSGSVLLAEDA